MVNRKYSRRKTKRSRKIKRSRKFSRKFRRSGKHSNGRGRKKYGGGGRWIDGCTPLGVPWFFNGVAVSNCIT